jgi:hypothetical protein
MVLSGDWACETEALHPTKNNQRTKETENCLYLRMMVPLSLIDKSLLLGELNLPKRELCVKAILAQDVGFV